MKIDVSEVLKEVGSELGIDVEEKISFPKDGLKLVKPVRIKARLTNAGEKLLLKGSAETEAALSCSRCLKDFSLPLKVEFEEKFSQNIKPEPSGKKEIELGEDDFVFPIEGKRIDLLEIMRQNLLTALPIKPLCSKDCRGIKEKEEK